MAWNIDLATNFNSLTDISSNFSAMTNAFEKGIIAGFLKKKLLTNMGIYDIIIKYTTALTLERKQ